MSDFTDSEKELAKFIHDALKESNQPTWKAYPDTEWKQKLLLLARELQKRGLK